MTPEGKVKERVKKLLKENDVFFFMPKGSTYGTQGIPDIICCIRGLFIGIETKAGHGVPTAMQKEQMHRIIENGGYTFCINERNFDELREWIETAVKALRKAEGRHFGLEI